MFSHRDIKIRNNVSYLIILTQEVFTMAISKPAAKPVAKPATKPAAKPVKK
jgi:hypothetical protein